jgi:endonuclease-8
MPEGHTVHRISKRFSKDFRDQRVRVLSPQGRFTEASVVSGKKLTDSQAFGKQLFLFFGKDIIRIHLGIYGKWSFQAIGVEIPEPKGQVRARFLVPELLADLRGPTACEVIGEEGYFQSLKKLGPDPIRNDPDGSETFVERILGRNRTIAELLMDQSVVAGIGNVYRAELLFRAKLNPLVPGKKVPKEIIESIWTDATTLMPIGVRTGLMLTRDGFLKGKPNLDERYYVYKRTGESCRECGGKISMQLLAGRKLYWCRRCQK